MLKSSSSSSSQGSRYPGGTAVEPKRVVMQTKWRPTIHVLATKHAIVLEAGLAIGLDPTEDEKKATLIWMDSMVTVSRLLSIQPWQRVNHFPGMYFVCHKDYLARTLARMRVAHSDEYAFSPRTWCMSTDTPAFLADARCRQKRHRSSARKWYIAKPESKARGEGIYLFSDCSDYCPSLDCDMVVQEYIDRPFLIDGFKFDLRVYALVTHCDPLRVYVYQEGLCRLATEQYTAPTAMNRAQIYMHLTNYSINRKSTKFVDGGAANNGSKRTLTWTLKHLDNIGHDGTGRVWSSIKSIIAKSLIAVKPELTRQFRSCFPKAQASPCFELLGFDILLDSQLKPYIIEVNHSPSLSVETTIDQQLKGPMLQTIYSMVLGQPSTLNPSKWAKASLTAAKRRLYRTNSSTSTTNSDPSRSTSDLRSTHTLLSRCTSSSSSSSACTDQVQSFPIQDRQVAWEMAHCGQFQLVLPDHTYRRLETSAELICNVPETITSRARRLDASTSVDVVTAISQTTTTTTKDPRGIIPTHHPISQQDMQLRACARIQQFVNKRKHALARRYPTSSSGLVSVYTLQVPGALAASSSSSLFNL